MAAAQATGGKTLTYKTARLVAGGMGLAIIAVLAAMQAALHVEFAEIAAVLLYVPIFIALLYWDVIGGLIAGILASLVYLALRWPGIEAVGFATVSGLVMQKTFAFIVFGVIGGLASRQLRSSLDKLDLYDQIDDATGLFNARFLLQETDLESARSKRYDSVFGVSVIDIPVSWFSAMSRKRREKVLRELGALMTGSVRTVDRAVHAEDATVHRFAVVLPETGPEGARTFTDKLAEQLIPWLDKREVSGAGELHTATITFPEDEEQLALLRRSFSAIDDIEHPLHNV